MATFTEFCCRSGGSNLNAGTRTGSSTEPGTAADLTYASGNWVQATAVFTVASGDPVADGVAVGDWVSVYPDGSTTTPYVARVTARTSTTITAPSTNSGGSKPTDGTGNRTLKVGGAWAGPNGADTFPFGFASVNMTSAANLYPRVNIKNDTTYNVTAAMTHSNASVRFEGYTSAYGDSGQATIDGGTTGASYTVLTVSANLGFIKNLIFDHNGSTGSADLCVASQVRQIWERCVFRNSVGNGHVGSAGPSYLVECEAYGNNTSNTANKAGFASSSALVYINTIAHDNSGSNSAGFYVSSNSPTYINCIAESNGSHGWSLTNSNSVVLQNCDTYNNGGSGVSTTNTCVNQFINCNFIKNGAYGVVGAASSMGYLHNCGFGAGTQANTSGATSTLGMIEESGTVIYPVDVTPWVDPANGDFRINLAAAINAGRSDFTQIAASYAGTVGYPDIGAAQHLPVAGAMAYRNDMRGNLG